MIKYHESFSTRIFLPTSASAESAARENLREFWWFLRAGREVSSPPPHERRLSARPPSNRGTNRPDIARAS